MAIVGRFLRRLNVPLARCMSYKVLYEGPPSLGHEHGTTHELILQKMGNFPLAKIVSFYIYLFIIGSRGSMDFDWEIHGPQ